jgi:hypothetical protein
MEARGLGRMQLMRTKQVLLRSTRAIVRVNRGGLISCAVYLIWLAILTWLSLEAKDQKGAYFLGQLSILPAQVFLWTSGVGQILEAHVASTSRINGPLLTVPLSFVVVYLLDWGMSAFAKVWSQATRDAEQADRE